MTRVMIFGSFDPLHGGHIDFFRQAKKYGDELIIVVSTVESIRKIKKREPQLAEDKRIETIKATNIADEVVLGHRQDHMYWLIIKKPDIICLGYDQKPSIDELKLKLKKIHLHPQIVRLKPYLPEQYKSSKIR